MENKELQDWMYENLLTRQEAMKITKQSKPAFDQSIRTGLIQTLFSKRGTTSNDTTISQTRYRSLCS